MFSSKSFIVSGLTFRSLIHFELVNHMPAMQETWVRFLSREDPLEKEMATHSSILAGESHGLSKDSQESDTTYRPNHQQVINWDCKACLHSHCFISVLTA